MRAQGENQEPGNESCTCQGYHKGCNFLASTSHGINPGEGHPMHSCGIKKLGAPQYDEYIRKEPKNRSSIRLDFPVNRGQPSPRECDVSAGRRLPSRHLTGSI